MHVVRGRVEAVGWRPGDVEVTALWRPLSYLPRPLDLRRSALLYDLNGECSSVPATLDQHDALSLF